MNEHLKPLLRVEGLECTRNDMVLFTGLDFSLIPGEVIQIDGPNGCGKTSLLRIICGLAQAAEGHVYWNGKDINDYAPAFLAQVNYIGHQNGIKNELTPLENLDIARKLSFSTTPLSQAREALHTFGLAGYEHTPVRMLSSGQRRRAALSECQRKRFGLADLGRCAAAAASATKSIFGGKTGTRAARGRG